MSAPPPAPALSPPPPPSGGAMSSEPADSPSDGSIISSTSTSTPPPQVRRRGGGGASAPPPPPPGCAACKHKRQKCLPGCILAPYFPAGDDPDKFRSVLRVFGVKNLLRTLREVPRPRWDACVRTVVYESRARLADPVRGCGGVVEDLEAQLMETAVELEVLRRRLESYRQAKRGGLRSLLRPPNPSQHGRAAAAASPRGVTDLGAARPQSGRARGDVMVMPSQGPHGGAAWPPATMAGLAATPHQIYAMQQHFSPVPPQLSATQPQGPQGAAWPPTMAGLAATPHQIYATQQQFSPVPPQLPATQPQGPQGAAWPPAMAGLAATPHQIYATQPQFSPVLPPQLPATQPQFLRVAAATGDASASWNTRGDSDDAHRRLRQRVGER